MRLSAGHQLVIRSEALIYSSALSLLCLLGNNQYCLSKVNSANVKLTKQNISNATCVIEHHKATLKNGSAYGASATKATDPQEDNSKYWSLSMRPDLIAIGDLNHDGKEDALAIVEYYCADSGVPATSHLVSFINRDGKPVQTEDISLGSVEQVDVLALSVKPGSAVARIAIRKPQQEKPVRTLDCTFTMSGDKLTPNCPAPQPSQLLLKKISLTPDAKDRATPAITSLELMPRIASRLAVDMAVKAPKVLTVSTLENGTYKIQGSGQVKLHNGSFTGTYPTKQLLAGESGKWSVAVTQSALGDLNADGYKDAAVILANNGGGSGTFYSLVPVVNKDGQLYQIGEVSLGDRIQVKELKIDSGVIHAGLLVHGPDDSMAEPTKRVNWRFKIAGNRLIKLQ